MAGLAADPDGDGRNNLDELVFGGNPRVAGARQDPATSVTKISTDSYLSITFPRRHNLLDVTVMVEVSTNLKDWTPVDIPVGAPVAQGNGIDMVTYRDSVAITPGVQRFIRVRAVK